MKVKAEACREIIETLMQMPNPSRGDLNRIKLEIARKYDLDGIPSNAEIISLLRPEEREKLLPILRRKATRPFQV